MLTLVIFVGVSVFILTCIAFLYAHIQKDNNILFLLFGVSLLVVVVFCEVLGKGESTRKLIVLTLVVVSAARLLVRMFERLKSGTQNKRFEIIKNTWGTWFITRTLFELYLSIGFLVCLLSLPVLLISEYGGGALNPLDYLGIIVWTLGFALETKADIDLDTFIRVRENSDHVLSSGLWKMSRHPNYFGELLEWLGISMIALSTPHGYLGIITFLIFVIGTDAVAAPLIEKEFEGNEAYDEYKRGTPKLVPKISVDPGLS